MNNLIISPEYQKLNTEIDSLRTKVSMLILEYDELRFVKGRNIEMAYMLEVGDLEYKLFKANCTYRRLKRKMQMIQAKLNRQEKIDIDIIDNLLDIEFKEYEILLKKRLEALNDAIDWDNSKVLSDQDTKELKKLYREIAKKLHPDLNPFATKEQFQLFLRAVHAYQNGNLASLRMIAALIEDDEYKIDSINSLDELKNVKSNLEDSLDKLVERIDKVKTKYPFTLQELLNDKKALQEKRESIQEEITKCQESIKELTQRINNALNGGEQRQWMN